MTWMKHTIVGYTYEADVHCPECTHKRFGPQYANCWHPRDEHGLPDYAARDEKAMRDREGNAVRPVFTWDERGESLTHCGDCGKELS